MLCDWLTLRYTVKTEADLALVESLSKGLDICFREKDGVVVSQWWPSQNTRSDSHQVTVRLSRTAIEVGGSPARIGAFNNVFGDAAPNFSARKMLRAVSVAKGVLLPPLERWKCTRVDLTQNYDCGVHARAALDALSKTSGGRLRVNTTYEDTIYWNLKSDLWVGKAYLKGPDLVRQIRRGKQTATVEEVALAHRLVRIEVMLRNDLLSRLKVGIADMDEAWAMNQYELFARKILPEGAAITGEQQLLQKLNVMFPKRAARSAYNTWLAMRENGPAACRTSMSRNTWFKHRKMLLTVGLSTADFNAAKVLQFRPRAILAAPVDSWEQLKRAA